MSFQRCGVCGVIADGKLCSGCELIEKDVRESGAFIAQLEYGIEIQADPGNPEATSIVVDTWNQAHRHIFEG